MNLDFSLEPLFDKLQTWINSLIEMLPNLIMAAIVLLIGLAFQDPILNLFSGIIISTRGFFNVGDLIEVAGQKGIITKITLRSAFLRTLSGHEVIIPNKDVASNPIENFTVLGSRRVDLTCGVRIKGGEKLSAVLNSQAGNAAKNGSQDTKEKSSTP